MVRVLRSATTSAPLCSTAVYTNITKSKISVLAYTNF